MNENPRGADGADDRADETRAAETRAAEDRADEARADEARAAEARDAETPADRAAGPSSPRDEVSYGAPALPGSTPRPLADEQPTAPLPPAAGQANPSGAGSSWQQPNGSQPQASQPAPSSHTAPTASYGHQAPYGQQPGYSQQPYGQQPYGQAQDSYRPATPYGQPQVPYGQQAPYGQQSAYGQQAPYGEQTNTAPHANGEPPYAFDSSTAYAGSSWSAPTTTPAKKRSGLGVVIGALAVGAIIGGVAGGGAYAALGGGSSQGSTAAGPSRDLTVNDYNDATVITAVAAKATKSVVTVNVSAGTSGGTGSGVILSDDGYIVTNTHVVTLDGASASGTITVTMSDGSIVPAKVVGLDPTVDLAVLKVDKTGLTPIQFADSSKLNVGDTAVAIGAPLGLSNTVTDGIVSTLNRSITVQSSAAPSDGSDQGNQNDNNGQGPFSFNNGDGNAQNQASSVISLPVIQTDASINPGNSGGALLDSDGKLIGLNVAIASSGDSQGSIGVGFSIPSNLVQRVAKEIQANGKASHGLLGASVGDATEDTKATQVGALIKEISSGGPAQAAGLRAGDVVTEFNGVPISNKTDLTAQVRYLAGGAEAKLSYVRDGKAATATVTLGTLPN
ncbi:trypsin-like peptidase domain-containing protein [Frigoribacterium sp. 2-23]|uniref:S1C family serine protease n=1 Tax=Frigoribacterium sp. 2-23 TaxID=3415006 RepID=UPI003C6EE679